MASRSDRSPYRPYAFRKKLHLHARESRGQHRPAPADKKSASTVSESLTAFLGKLSIIPLGALFSVLCLGSGLLGGYILGKFSPECMVTVEPFEILPEAGSPGALSGKVASDIVVDILNDVADHAAQFHGTDYYHYRHLEGGIQPVSLDQAIKIPVQSSYGIELKGISLDSLLHLYDQARYDQWIVSGDVISSPSGLVGRIRLNSSGSAKSWETQPYTDATPSELVRKATYLMLEDVVPELLGRSYLEQGRYDDAAEIFRKWQLEDPQNWKPSYYLSLAFNYEDKPREASTLARWSNDLASRENDRISKDRVDSGESDEKTASRLAQTTQVAMETGLTSDTQTLDRLQHTLDNSEPGESKLIRLLVRPPANVDYRIQQARVLDKEASVDLDKTSLEAYQRSNRAVDMLKDAIRRVPGNGGLHEQRAIALMHLVKIMKKRGEKSADIMQKESEEAAEYTRALELRPTEDSAMWGAVYAQIHLGNYEDAIDLARTIDLLRPGQNPARAAYIVALARSNSAPEPETQKEIRDRIAQLLESNPEESQLSAIWHALRKSNDRDDLDLVATAAKQLFPENPSFEERRLLRHMERMGRSGDQTADLKFPASRVDRPM